MRDFEFDRAIVREPAASVVRGLRAGDREGPSFDGVRSEHAAYVEALRRAGLAVTVLPPLEAHPDSIFVEDPALVFPEGAILLRPGAPSRAAESAALEPALREAFAVVLDLPSGHVDGGDVLVTPDEVLVGLSERTDPSGAAALLELLERFGRTGVVVSPPAGTLHLKSACSLIDEQTVLATADLAASGIFAGRRVLTVPAGEEAAANALRLNETVLVGSAFPRTLDLLAAHGVAPIALETTEISKLDAGLSCLSLRWRAAAAQR